MVGDRFLNENFIVIYSYTELVNGNSAASARMMNYAKAISLKYNVIILSYVRSYNIRKYELIEVERGIYTTGVKDNNINSLSVFKFFSSINSLVKEMGRTKVVSLLLYPTTNTTFDIISLFYFKKIKRLKLFCEINEIRQYSTNLLARDKKNIKEVFIRKVLISKYKFFESVTKYFDGLICISTNIEKYYNKINKNIIRIPILTDIKFSKIISRKFDIKESFKIGFFGSISYEKENFDLLFRSLSIFKNEYKINNFIVDFHGPLFKDSLSRIKIDVNRYKLEDNVNYKGKVNQDGIINYMQKYDLLILPRGDNLQNKYGFSTKLSEYLISGIPILITDVSDNSLYIKDNINGFIVQPDDYIAFANKMKFIYSNYDDYYFEISKNSMTTAVNNFSYHKYSDKLINFLC